MASIKEQLGAGLRKDGVDHVNVSAHAETELGKMVSPDWRRKFFIPHIGDFISARSFANWLLSGGDEELRLSSKFYKTNVSLSEFRNLLLFGKYFQLYSMRQGLGRHEPLLELPWVMYKMHLSGVREMDRLVGYTDQARDLTRDVMRQATQRQVHPPHEWASRHPQILASVNQCLAAIAGKDFIPFERLDAVSRERSAERGRINEERHRERNADRDRINKERTELHSEKAPVNPEIIDTPESTEALVVIDHASV